MDDSANEQLRFDNRLSRREGWVNPADLAQELDSLPDVSDKIAAIEDEPASPATDTEGEAPGA